MSDPFSEELAVAREACEAAAALIRQIGPDHIVAKPDGSPVTAADLRANEIILATLARSFPDDGVLSEESTDSQARLQKPRVWIVDPLDGTRDFVHGTGQYAVHVGLAVQGKATLGVVAEPAACRVSWAVRGQGAFVSESGERPQRLAVSKMATFSDFRIGTTRYAMSPAVQAFLSAEPPLAGIPMGASTKLMALARAELEACVWLSAAEKEWDTCAPEVIVEEAGGCLTDALGHPFVYNKRDVVHRLGIVASHGLDHVSLLARAARFFP
ncbi:MAG: 3'(2'),5'-bisphosphate nucleotidase CysQ [Deltaproteobacteria bacterium]|nr:3'(2'),5'-bisphosphate nucleotidase CysQ [Deltaproteobacteria bacterium]